MLSEEEFRAELWARVEASRQSRGLSIAELCRTAGVAKRNWWLWRHGSTPRAYALYRLSLALDMTYEDLMP